MARPSSRLRVLLSSLFVVAFAACSKPGINAGGESATNNGGVAFIAFAGMLLGTLLILWLLLGRGD